MTERIERIRKDVTELDKYVIRNKEIIKKLKEQYERAVNINKRLIGRIRAMKKEIIDLKRGQYGICEVYEDRSVKALDSEYTELNDEENDEEDDEEDNEEDDE